MMNLKNQIIIADLDEATHWMPVACVLFLLETIIIGEIIKRACVGRSDIKARMHERFIVVHNSFPKAQQHTVPGTYAYVHASEVTATTTTTTPSLHAFRQSLR